VTRGTQRSRQRGKVGRFPFGRAGKLEPDPRQLQVFLGRKGLGAGDDRGGFFKLEDVLQSDHGDGNARDRPGVANGWLGVVLDDSLLGRP